MQIKAKAVLYGFAIAGLVPAAKQMMDVPLVHAGQFYCCNYYTECYTEGPHGKYMCCNPPNTARCSRVYWYYCAGSCV
jgi:hypothetical protein